MKVHKFRTALDTLENTLMLVGALAIFIMIFLVTADVSARQFFNSPIAGQPEITEMLMVFSVYLGMAYTQRDGGQIGLDFLVKRMKPPLRRSCLWITHLLSLFINGIVTVYAFLQSIQSYHEGTRSIFLYWPMWPLPMAVALGSFILCVRLALDLVSDAQMRRQHSDVPVDL